MPRPLDPAPIVKQDSEKRIVIAPVLVPDEPDSDDDVVKAADIERVAHEFMRKYQNIDLMHTLNNVGTVVQSFIAPHDLTYLVDGEVVVVPKGAWLLGVHVDDDGTWQAVKNGTLTGLSMMAVSAAALKAAGLPHERALLQVAAQGADDDFDSRLRAAAKRVTLDDLGEDWIVNFVSLVDEPAVPAAKYLVVKGRGTDTPVLQVRGGDNTGPRRARKVWAPVPGSHEHIRGLIWLAIDQRWPEPSGAPTVEATFDDSVLLRLWEDWEPQGFALATYSYDADAGTLTLSEDLQDVQVEATIKGTQDTRRSAATKGDGQDGAAVPAGLLRRIAKALGIDTDAPAEQEESNRAVDAEAVAAAVRRSVKAAATGIVGGTAAATQTGEDDMSDEAKKGQQDDLATAVAAAAKAAVEEAFEPVTKRLDAFEERLDAIEDTGSATTKAAGDEDEKEPAPAAGKGEGEGDEAAASATKAGDDGKEATKAAAEKAGEGEDEPSDEQVEKALDALATGPRRFHSLGLRGQDGDSVEAVEKADPSADRDLFGRSMKRRRTGAA